MEGAMAVLLLHYVRLMFQVELFESIIIFKDKTC